MTLFINYPYQFQRTTFSTESVPIHREWHNGSLNFPLFLMIKGKKMQLYKTEKNNKGCKYLIKNRLELYSPTYTL